MRRVVLTLAVLLACCTAAGQDPPRRDDGPTVPLMGLAPTGQYVLTLPPSAVVTLSPGRIVVDLGGGPTPQPPVPPGPNPVPVPPQPTPTPVPVPPSPQAKISRVLVVFDPDRPITGGQTQIAISTPVRQYLEATCDKDADGRAAYRFWTTDIDTSDESAGWRAAWNRVAADTKIGLPKVYVFDTSGAVRATPLPADPDAFLAKLKSIGGG